MQSLIEPLEPPPWRRPSGGVYEGVPAWGAPSAELRRVEIRRWPPDAVADWAFGGSTGAGVRVCVLDTGVDPTHPMIGTVDATMGIESDEAGALRVVPVPPGDPAGHGTACASIIRAIAPQCRLTSVRVLAAGFNGDGSALLAGLEWAIDEGYDVINMSLSTSKPVVRARLAELCDTAYFRRTLICAAAHNAPVQSFPWRFSAVVSVASTDTAQTATGSHYYNLSPPVEFLAPGVGVRVAWSNHAVIRATGNSFATPHVTGLCALLLSKHPGLTPFETKTILYLTSANVWSQP